MHRLRVGIAQINTTVGDFTGNTQKILEYIEQSRSLGVDLLTFPELAVCGYPPEDLLFKPKFISENLKSLEKIIDASPGITLVVGFVDSREDIYNAAAIIHEGKLVSIYHKIFLPNYGVFDEDRYFRAGNECSVYELAGIKFGINICEDIWYEAGLATTQAYSGAEIIVNISASPYHFNRGDVRERMLATRAADNVAVFIYNNLVGGQDELVFDGNSLIVDETGKLVARGKQFEEDLIIADIDTESVFRSRLHDPRWRKDSFLFQEKGWRKTDNIIISNNPIASEKPAIETGFAEDLEEKAEVYKALVLGTRDYIRKNGFQKVLIGLSGGIDSSLVAAIAVDALGNENVVGVSMPSRYSSEGSKTDAELLAERLDIRYLSIPIEKAFAAYLEMLEDSFEGTEPNVAEENLQARIRGNLLMALSNKFGWLVLTTGNKSETATGYSTLYGDMAGGFAVIKDVPKTMVYDLCRYRNTLSESAVIPETVIDKPPSAELRPDQKDVDSLPPYEILDPVLTAYVEEDKSIEQIISLGFEEKAVRRAAYLVDGTEYKRRQAPPGIKITPRAFGRDRRLPITNHFKG
ncbi:MAG: NAD+ synthase [Dehalococcoidales bacterium]|nr:NAD+ synthase [Dehalococcoidales bacterium]